MFVSESSVLHFTSYIVAVLRMDRWTQQNTISNVFPINNMVCVWSRHLDCCVWFIGHDLLGWFCTSDTYKIGEQLIYVLSSCWASQKMSWKGARWALYASWSEISLWRLCSCATSSLERSWNFGMTLCVWHTDQTTEAAYLLCCDRLVPNFLCKHACFHLFPERGLYT